MRKIECKIVNYNNNILLGKDLIINKYLNNYLHLSGIFSNDKHPSNI